MGQDRWAEAASIQVLNLVAQVTENLDSEPERPTFVRGVEKPADRTASSTAPGGSGYGPNFGSIPDFNEPPTGVRFADVRDGTPAALAGLKAGDIMVKFGDQDIRNLYDFTYALRARKPGDEVIVEVLRGDKKISAKVKLTERK